MRNQNIAIVFAGLLCLLCGVPLCAVIFICDFQLTKVFAWCSGAAADEDTGVLQPTAAGQVSQHIHSLFYTHCSSMSVMLRFTL